MTEETLQPGEKYLGREVKNKITFSVLGTFQSLYAAQGWCHENNYEYGSLCRDKLVAMQLDRYDLPQKWQNMDAEDKAAADGVMVSNDFREGSITIYIFK